MPDEPVLLGTTDACKFGIGGTLFAHGKAPILWHAPFPAVSDQVARYDNPQGDVTNSNLEQAVLIAQGDVVAVHIYDTRNYTIATGSDNTPAIARLQRGAITSNRVPAYLCRLQCLHQRHYRHLHQAFYIKGEANAMADDCSRLWNLDDSQLLSHFNRTYPQDRPWKLWTLDSATHSALILALRTQRSKPGSFPRPHPGAIATSRPGKLTAPLSTSTPISATSRTNSRWTTSSYLPSDCGEGGYPAAASPSGVNAG